MKNVVAALLIITAACSGSSSSGEDPTTTAGPLVVDGIAAEEFDGTWLFWHQPDGGNDALHGGLASVVNGCLYVDDAVVIWHADDLARAQAIVQMIAAGESPTISVGGGGISLDEDGGGREIPQLILERCPTRAIWYGNAG